MVRFEEFRHSLGVIVGEEDLAPSSDRWVRYTSGPFEVLTDAGERAGQETMVRFEEFRHSLGVIVGEEDLATPQPVRILVFRNAQGWTSPAPLTRSEET